MDVDRCVEKFTSLMIETAYISMPVKKPRTHARMSPWWDNGLEQLRMTVRNTRNDFAHERDLETRSQKYNVYKRFRNRFANACQKTKIKLEEISGGQQDEQLLGIDLQTYKSDH